MNGEGYILRKQKQMKRRFSKQMGSKGNRIITKRGIIRRMEGDLTKIATNFINF